MKDTIHLGGMECMVFMVDETGMSGKAITPPAFYNAKNKEKEIEKMKNDIRKRYEKKIKKGEATQEDMETALALTDGRAKLPYLNMVETNKNRYVFQVEDWYATAPEGFRLPSRADVDDLVEAIKNDGFGLKWHKDWGPNEYWGAQNGGSLFWANYGYNFCYRRFPISDYRDGTHVDFMIPLRWEKNPIQSGSIPAGLLMTFAVSDF